MRAVKEKKSLFQNCNFYNTNFTKTVEPISYKLDYRFFFFLIKNIESVFLERRQEISYVGFFVVKSGKKKKIVICFVSNFELLKKCLEIL